MRTLIFLLVILISSTAFANPQEIKLSKEAAPAHITQNATFMTWKNGKFEIAKKGSNDFTCLVLRDDKGRFEPSCLNTLAMESVFPVYEYQTRLLEQGESIQSIYENIARKHADKKLPSPKPGSIVYMMSPNNKFYDHFNKKLMDVEPHIMLYLPKIKHETIGLNGKSGLPGMYDEYPHMSVIHVHTTH